MVNRILSMPRAPRIEYEDAIYHVMARGNQRRAIVFSDADRDLFVDTLAETCAQTQWRVFAFALMTNHYHLVIQTPSPNLVSGMTWFQNAFTRRINASNRLWGRLFGDRYKAVLDVNWRINHCTARCVEAGFGAVRNFARPCCVSSEPNYVRRPTPIAPDAAVDR